MNRRLLACWCLSAAPYTGVWSLTSGLTAGKFTRGFFFRRDVSTRPPKANLLACFGLVCRGVPARPPKVNLLAGLLVRSRLSLRSPIVVSFADLARFVAIFLRDLQMRVYSLVRRLVVRDSMRVYPMLVRSRRGRCRLPAIATRS